MKKLTHLCYFLGFLLLIGSLYQGWESAMGRTSAPPAPNSSPKDEEDPLVRVGHISPGETRTFTFMTKRWAREAAADIWHVAIPVRPALVNHVARNAAAKGNWQLRWQPFSPMGNEYKLQVSVTAPARMTYRGDVDLHCHSAGVGLDGKKFVFANSIEVVDKSNKRRN